MPSDEHSEPNDPTPGSFEAWVVQEWDGLRRFAFIVVGNRHDGEDALQDALVGLCMHWAKVAARGDPGAYVRRSIANARVSLWRRSRHSIAVPDASDSLGFTPGPENGVTDVVVLEELCQSLSSRQRAVIVMHFLEDRDYKEIASLMGCTQAAARSVVRHALAVLAARFGEGEK